MAIGDKPKKHTEYSLIHCDCNSFLVSKNKRSQLMQKKHMSLRIVKFLRQLKAMLSMKSNLKTSAKLPTTPQQKNKTSTTNGEQNNG